MMPELSLCKNFLALNDDISLYMAPFVAPETWRDFAEAAEIPQFTAFVQQILLGRFAKLLCLPGKTNEDSLFVWLQDVGVVFASSDTLERYLEIWDYIKRIRADSESVCAEQRVMLALLFPNWLRAALTPKERQVAHITAVLLQKIQTEAAQEISLVHALTQWLFLGQGIYTVFSALWRKRHIRLVLQEMLGKVEATDELNSDPNAALNTQLKGCFVELKRFCDTHGLTQSARFETLWQRAIDDHHLLDHSRVFELLVCSRVELCRRRIQNGGTLLHIAADKGYVAVVRQLLDAGVDINHLDRVQGSALHMASESGHVDMVKVLLMAGAAIDLVDEDGRTALYWAAWRGHEMVVDQLLAAGANVNLVTVDGLTALDRAVCANSAVIVERLLAAGADIHYVAEGLSILHWAARNHAEIVKILLAAGANPMLSDVTGQTALHTAAFYQCAESIELLLAAGTNPHAADENGQTALHIAARGGCAKSIKRLLAAGLDINAVDQHQQTALHLAARGHYAEAVDLLLATGLNANAVDEYGQTALHLAVYPNSAATVQRLLSAGVDVNVRDVEGKTALHIAAFRSDIEMQIRLLAAGVDPHLVDMRGQSALHIAASMGALIHILLKSGIDVNLADAEGKTALHCASYRGHADVVRVLLAAGADVICVDAQGKTAAHIAAERGHTAVVKQLQPSNRLRLRPNNRF